MLDRRVLLKKVGATNPDGDQGVIPVSPSSERRVISYQVTDTTSAIRTLRMNLGKRIQKRRLDLDVVRAQGFFKKACTQYRDPKILFDLIPIKVKNMEFKVFSLKLAGDIENEIGNNGDEGEEGRTTVARWKACPSDPDQYQWQKIVGSADIVPNWVHQLAEDNTGAILGKVSQQTDKLNLGSRLSADARWESGGLGDLAWQVIQLIITGTISTRNGFDVTVNYDWQGSQSINRHIDTRVILPVEGDISWSWS